VYKNLLNAGIFLSVFMFFGYSLATAKSIEATLLPADFINEDFSSASGTTPPLGWVNDDIAGNGDVWHFDNPGDRNIKLPLSMPVAIFDSRNYGDDNVPEEAALTSPTFDGTGTQDVFLEIDHYLKSGQGGEAHVEVFNGTDWVILATYTTGMPQPTTVLFDISTHVSGVVNAQVRFRWVGDYSWYWLVDNVRVYGDVSADIVIAPTELDVIVGGTETVTHTLTMSNTGTLNLDWQLSESSCLTPNDVAWMSPSQTQGILAGGSSTGIDVAFDGTLLSAGIYTSTLCVASNDPDEGIVFIPINVQVCEGVTAQNHTISQTGGNSVDLNWSSLSEPYFDVWFASNNPYFDSSDVGVSTIKLTAPFDASLFWEHLGGAGDVNNNYTFVVTKGCDVGAFSLPLTSRTAEFDFSIVAGIP
jgi:hypothetical protein